MSRPCANQKTDLHTHAINTTHTHTQRAPSSVCTHAHSSPSLAHSLTLSSYEQLASSSPPGGRHESALTSAAWPCLTSTTSNSALQVFLFFLEGGVVCQQHTAPAHQLTRAPPRSRTQTNHHHPASHNQPTNQPPLCLSLSHPPSDSHSHTVLSRPHVASSAPHGDHATHLTSFSWPSSDVT